MSLTKLISIYNELLIASRYLMQNSSVRMPKIMSKNIKAVARGVRNS